MANLNATYGIRGSIEITPNDTTTIDATRGVLVDVAGDVKVTFVDIWSTGTTATGIHAGY